MCKAGAQHCLASLAHMNSLLISSGQFKKNNWHVIFYEHPYRKHQTNQPACTLACVEHFFCVLASRYARK